MYLAKGNGHSRIHFFNCQHILLVLDLVEWQVFVVREADALVYVVSGFRGRRLYPGGTRKADLVVDCERLFDVPVEVGWAEQDSNRSGIFDCHARTLALVGHHWVAGIAEEADSLLVEVGVGVMDPKPPRLDFFADGEVTENLSVKLGVGLQQLFDWAVFGTPGLVYVVALVSRKEAVVGEEFATVARGQDDLVPLALLTSPVLESFVK